MMPSSLPDILNTPLTIGGKTIENRLVLAPMAQLGHIAFRELLADFGGFGLMFSEMCSAKRIRHENRLVSPYFRWRDQELGRLVWQIFGNDPDIMAEAARRIEAEGFFGVDINFGCAAGAICAQAGGAAVLKDPELAGRIVYRIRRAVGIPVLVKFRTGWEDNPRFAVEMAKRFEAAGADGLTFHPRVAPDRRAQRPKWAYIERVKAAVRIPVFGNGDVFSSEACREMLSQTGCDGVAVGRMAVARPWVLARWSGQMPSGPAPYYETARRLSENLQKHFEPKDALRRFVRFSLYFSANFLFGHSLHTRISNARDMAGAQKILGDFFETPPAVVSSPNMNFFR
jgi:nifR3 family TIM-barrel protein